MKASAIPLVLLAACRIGAVVAQAQIPTPTAAAQAPGKVEPQNHIEVTGQRDAVAQRRLSTAAKIIVTREEIEQYGDLSLADVIKRLPSVTVAGRPGRGGQIRLRGMGKGYTQILIDGERLPPGFAIDQLAPDQIERIEILRAPTAETGARAIAGTIDIILREPLRRRGDDLRLGLGSERGSLQPNASWTRNDVLGERGNYKLNLSLSHSDQRTDTQTATAYTDLGTGAVALQQHRLGRQHDLTASTQRVAAYLQDEWDPAPAWSAYAGLRWESIRTRSVSIGTPVSNTGRVLTPLAHAVWRFNAPARDQLRFSLTRSDRPPTLGNLSAVPRNYITGSTVLPSRQAQTVVSGSAPSAPA
jgi:outer membrane receptor for monomeric catechols